MTKDEAKKELEEVKARVEALEEIINKPDDELMLVVESEALWIYYCGENIGCITGDGYCYILNLDCKVEAYESWRENGMKVNHDSIEWNGGEYAIDNSLNLKRIDIKCGGIYNFSGIVYLTGCFDTNIQRHKHNNRPIGY